MLPYATNEDVIRICKELIKEGGSQPQPESNKSYIGYYDEIKTFFETLADDEGELPGGFEETYSLEGATVGDICNLWEDLDVEVVKAAVSFMSGHGPEESARGHLECLYNMTVNGQKVEEEGEGFITGQAYLDVSFETDMETGDARAVPAVCLGSISVDESIPVHGTLKIIFVPAN